MCPFLCSVEWIISQLLIWKLYNTSPHHALTARVPVLTSRSQEQSQECSNPHWLLSPRLGRTASHHPREETLWRLTLILHIHVLTLTHTHAHTHTLHTHTHTLTHTFNVVLILKIHMHPQVGYIIYVIKTILILYTAYCSSNKNVLTRAIWGTGGSR